MAKTATRKAANKEIVALDDFEHVRLKPTMWLGSIALSDEKVPIVKDGKLTNESKPISVAFYKCMNEILDNAFDEAKRLRGSMPKIEIHFDSKTKEVSVHDYGEGFYNGTSINSKTGITNIETAMSELKAGTNFFQHDDEDTLIGTNGVGASLVNMLSKEFTIETINKDTYFKKTWRNFIGETSEIRKRKRDEKTGTKISFILLDETQVRTEKVKLFKDFTWDKEYVETLMIFRNYLKATDEITKGLEFLAYFDGKEIDLNKEFLPAERIEVNTKLGKFVFWERHENSTSISFVNGAQCTGIQQKIFNDWINDEFDYNLAHHFYETMVILNLPPKFVRFADQNKTKFATGRWEIEDLVETNFKKRVLRDVKSSNIYNNIQKKIDERMFNENINKINREKKKSKKKVSDKYFAPSGVKDTLFIVEGNCLDENTEIIIYRDNQKMVLPIKDTMIGDEVLTHKHRFREIISKQRKLKSLKEIKLDNGEVIKASEDHRFYIYDTQADEFKFLKVKDIDTKIHKFVKSKLSEFIGTVEVIDVFKSDGKFKHGLTLENGEIYENTEFHKYCVFDEKEQKFEMKYAKEIRKGDLISTFNIN